MNSKPLNKTRTFQFNMSSSMEKPAALLPPAPPLPKPQQLPNNNNKSPLLEFPTSPQLKLGQEILHFSHPQHPLLEVDLSDLFTCAGCKEYGAGKRFVCSRCDFQLHDFCALAPTSLNSHPLHTHHQLVFHSKPVKGFVQSKCGVCAKPTKGFNFQCKACSFQMHPSCAMLSGEIQFPGHVHALKMAPTSTTSSNGDAAGYVCGECTRKRSGRVYHCGVCDYHLHAVCAKSMVNGLYDNGFRGKEKPGMFGTATKIASQVVVDFIGGLMEGLGEGVAQAIIGQNFARGNRGTRN